MKRKFSRAFTIEYAIVLMVIVIAFTGLLLSLAMVTINYSKAYQEYLDYKRDLDALGDSFISGESSIEKLRDSALLAEHDLTIDAASVEDEMLIIRHGTNGAVALTVQLSSDDEGVRVVRYIYGEIPAVQVP